MRTRTAPNKAFKNGHKIINPKTTPPQTAGAKKKKPEKESAAIPLASPLTKDEFKRLTQEAIDNGLPFFYAKTKTKKPARIYLAHSITPEFISLRGDYKNKSAFLNTNKKASQYNFFVTYSFQKKGVRLGSGEAFIETAEKTNIFLLSALHFDQKTAQNSPSDVIDIAALFHSGTFFPQDKEYAHTLLKMIKNRNEKEHALGQGLTTAALKEEFLPLLKSFIDLGANINYKGPDGSVALPTALFNENFKAAEFLQKAGASVTVRDISYGSAEELIRNMEGSDSD